MSNVVLFHSALGLNDGMRAMAQVLEDEGHRVFIPDYYKGRTFDSAEEGTAHRDEVTFPVLAQRASAALDELPAEVRDARLVFGGFSLGAAIAQSMGKRDPRAAGALLFHAGGVPKLTSWQESAPLQIHHSVDDPWIDGGAPELLVESAARAGANAAHFVYPGAGHLFADPTNPEYDPVQAGVLWQRVLAFLGSEATDKA